MRDVFCTLLFIAFTQTIIAQNNLKLLSIGAFKPNQDSVTAVYLDGNKVIHQSMYRENTSQQEGDFSFFTGSCAWLLPRNYRVFKTLEKRADEAEFMLWLGDIVYSPNYARVEPVKLRRWQNKGILKERFSRQYIQYMSRPKRLKFAQKIPNYACLDDHDIGQNNTTFKYYDINQIGLSVLKSFYPNEHWAKKDGGYYTYHWKDCAYFVLDSRNFSAPPKTWLGDEQMQWIKAELLKSKTDKNVNFRFIAVGNQVIARRGGSLNTSKEKDELVNFVFENGIEGVIFLSGDVHTAELSKEEFKGKYPLYDFTSSALASPAHPLASNDKHQHQVSNVIGANGKERTSFFKRRNYGKITISGESTNRKCTLQVFSNTGKLIWTYAILANDLRLRQ